MESMPLRIVEIRGSPMYREGSPAAQCRINADYVNVQSALSWPTGRGRGSARILTNAPASAARQKAHVSRSGRREGVAAGAHHCLNIDFADTARSVGAVEGDTSLALRLVDD